MRRLIPRPNHYALPNQVRSHRQAIIRWIYVACVVGLAAWLGDRFLGHFFYLRSEGMVLAQRAVIAAEFPVTVRQLLVREGERVEAGRVAAIVSSQSVAETIARLAADLAGRQARLGELRIRSEKVDAVVSIADVRQRAAIDARVQFETLVQKGLLSIDRRTAAIESEFRSRQDFESLKAEKRVVQAEIGTLSPALAEAETAMRDLRRLYDDGRIRVPIDGIVTGLAAEIGSVVRVGDALANVYGNQRFVLAYLPTGGVYDVAAGDRVSIKTGFLTVEGIVARVEPFAAALPREFQGAFVPVDRQQVIRVEFAPGELSPPLFAKVELRSASLIPRWMSRIWEGKQL